MLGTPALPPPARGQLLPKTFLITAAVPGWDALGRGEEAWEVQQIFFFFFFNGTWC